MRGKDTWQRISKRKLRKLLLDDLAADLDEYNETGHIRLWRNRW